MIRIYLGNLREFGKPRRENQRMTADLFAQKFLGETPKREENGKPVVTNGHISISHSGDLVALAVSEHDIGVDLEEARPRHMGFWQRVFGEGVGYPEWCQKEAYVKMLGTGFCEHPRTVQVPQEVWCRSFDVAEYVLAVCAKAEDSVELHREVEQDVWETALLHR